MVRGSLTNVTYYGDEYGELLPLIAGSFHIVAADNQFIIGLYINESVYPLYNRDRQQVVVTIIGDHTIVMTEELHEDYDHYFVRIRSHTPRRSRRRWHLALPRQ